MLLKGCYEAGVLRPTLLLESSVAVLAPLVLQLEVGLGSMRRSVADKTTHPAFEDQQLTTAQPDEKTSRRPQSSDLPPPRSHRLFRFWDLHATHFIVGGGLALGLMTGLVFWHRDSTGGTWGSGQFFFDVVVVGIVVCAPLAMLALALTDWAVGFFGGLFIILLGDLFHWLSTQRNGGAAKAGDTEAQARIDHWKRWQKKWAR